MPIVSSNLSGTRSTAKFIFAAVLGVLFLFCVEFSVFAADQSENENKDPDEMLAEDVLIELPETSGDRVRAPGWSGGVPLIVVLPFAADARSSDIAAALAYGCASGIIDNIYPLSAVRTIPLDRLIRAAGSEVIASGLLGSAMTSESVQAVAVATGADYIVTGDVIYEDKIMEITAVIFDAQGVECGRSQIGGSQNALPGLISRLSYDILKVCNVALTDEERSYLDYTEPYGFDAWSKCHYGLSVVTLMLAGFEVGKGEIGSARRELTAALKTAPEYLRAREALGILEYITNHGEEAESEFRELETLYPKHAPARYYLGVLAYNRGDYGEAKKELTIASELNKSDPLAWLYLGRTHLAVQQPVMAEQALIESLRIDPTNPDTFFALGLAQIAQNDYRNGEVAFAEVVMRKPAMPEAHYNLAICYYYNNDYDMAIKHFRNYIELTPEDASGDHEAVLKLIEDISNAKNPVEEDTGETETTDIDEIDTAVTAPES